jgi:hypothetical protein
LLVESSLACGHAGVYVLLGSSSSIAGSPKYYRHQGLVKVCTHGYDWSR